jgi:hypothetical protein
MEAPKRDGGVIAAFRKKKSERERERERERV